MNEKAISLKDKSVFGVLKDSLLNASVGFLNQESKFSSLSRVLIRKNNSTYFERFYQEFEELNQAGKVKAGFTESDEGMECLYLLIDCFEKYPMKEDKFKILKRIYFIACQHDIKEFEVLPSAYMKIAVTLESEEILILAGCLKLQLSGRAGNSDIVNNPHLWSLEIAKLSGLKTKELVDSYAEKLATKMILYALHKSGGFESNGGKNGRLTSLGLELCKFLEEKDVTLS
ncbi:MAG: hypothetical protein Q7S55_05365 [Nanoarchaeota archaeon]|nr:hypothetical protein [Nanoarchaeota archaeon]